MRLPPRSAAQLLVDVQTARLEGVSGTVVERADLGLIALPPGIGGGAAGSSGIDLASLISGSNAMRVWYSGKDKARVALIRSNGESDIVHNGTDTWLWNSRDNTATHYQESDKDARPHPEAAPSGLPLTDGIADRASARCRRGHESRRPSPVARKAYGAFHH